MGKNYIDNKPNFHSLAIENIFTGEPETIQGDMPKVKGTIDCNTHGKVDLVYFPTYEHFIDRFDGKPATSYKVSQYCKECVTAEMVRLEAEHRISLSRKREEAAHSRFLQTLELRGVSVRNSDIRLNDITPKNAKQEEALNAMKSMAGAIKSGKRTGNLILIGGVGTGKTMLTSGLVCDLIVDGHKPAIRRVIDIIRKLKNTWRKDSEITEDQLIDNLVDLDLLIIDEIGVQFGSDTEKMFIFDIIDGRYNKMKPTILVSNLTLEGIKECIGDRCVDRLREDGGKVIAFDFDSQRGRK
jgi:DNA replication protein DnaC